MRNPIGVCQWMRTTLFLSWQYKRQAQFEGVIIASHFLDFEHLIEYLRLCLFQLGCIFSEPPPLSELTVYMPLGTATTKSLPSNPTGHHSLSIRLLVPGIYTYSGWSKPLTPFCWYYSVAHQTGQSQGRQIPHQPLPRVLWRSLAPEGQRTYSRWPCHYFGRGLRMVHFVFQRSQRSWHHHVRIRHISTFLHKMPHHPFFSIRDTRYLRRETLFVGTKDEKQVSNLHSLMACIG